LPALTADSVSDSASASVSASDSVSDSVSVPASVSASVPDSGSGSDSVSVSASPPAPATRKHPRPSVYIRRMTSPAVHFALDRHVGTITLDRPTNRNSMTPELLDAFAAAVAAARSARELRCLIITGTGACFSAGADFKSTVVRDDGPARAPHEQSFAMYQPFLSVLDLEVPVIGALNGHAVGGGFGLALCCDLRLGARGARYGANFARLGLHPGMAITYLLPRLVGVARAAELLFTGRLIDGDEAARIGLLSSVHDPGEVLPAAQAIATAIASNAPLAVRETKRSLYRGLGWDPRSAAYLEAFAQAESLTTSDAAEGIAALLGKRDPVFTGR
jgi:enoyl-CoA hydratase/carnithine racemase